MTLDDAFDLTPELKAAAQAEMKKFRLGPLYTPPSMEGTLVRPGVWGGANWGGGAFDPETGMLYLKTVGLPQVFRIQKRDPNAPTNRPGEVDADYVNRGLSGYFMEALPLTKPPYAHLVAIDLNKGTIAWREPFGDLPAVREAIEKLGVKPPEKLGAQGPPGLVVTKSGLHLRRRRRSRLPCRRCRDRQGSVVGGDAGNDRDADDLRGRRPAVRGRRDRAGIRGHAGRLRAAAIGRFGDSPPHSGDSPPADALLGTVPVTAAALLRHHHRAFHRRRALPAAVHRPGAHVVGRRRRAHRDPGGWRREREGETVVPGA